ncbi:carbohydrate ABC transporter permease [Gottschalkiaceae bacterium SANA]|nr:carbohydrate ABC transporter permease [Gottschalkiaceae bacterium SANA]
MKQRNSIRVMINCTGVILAFAFALPLLITVLMSVMGKTELDSLKQILESGKGISLWHLIPKSFSLRQYFTVLINRLDFLKMYWNSLGLVLPIVLGQMVVGTLTAYGFAKFRFRFRDPLFYLFMVAMLIPFQVTLVPNFIMAIRLGTYDHAAAIYLPGIFHAFAVFYMKQYLREIPDELIEAARVDGAGELRIFWQVVMPIAKPFVFSLAVLSFIDYWNMVEQPLIMLSDASKFPLSMVLATSAGKDFNIAFGASVLYLIPALLLYFASRKDLESGLKNLAMK